MRRTGTAMRRGLGLAAGLGMIVAAAPASAKWMRATSDHFVIYADQSPAELEKMATRLERFDGAIRYLHHTPEASGAKGTNRVTVYVADDVAAIRKLSGDKNIAGFYIPRASGSVAFTPRTGDTGGMPQIVLFHEYAHHFLLGNYAAAYPGWFSEGYAEFVSTAAFEKTYVQLGVAAQHRAYSLLEAKPLPATALFATGQRLTDDQRASLYAQGWLLTHYIMFDAVRGKQLTSYLSALNSGTPSIAAATAAFGDLRALDKALTAYLHQSRIPGVRIPYDKLPAVTVEVTPLSPAAAALIELRMQSERGVNRTTAQPIFARAAKIAAAYPGDALAQGWLAEMAYDTGNDVEAEAAVDRALAADPTSAQAMLYKARVLVRRAALAKSSDPAVWKEARRWIVKANRQSPDDADALELYYDSFRDEGAKPPAAAIAGIRRALELVPQDPSLRFRVAAQAIMDGDNSAAKTALRPLAFDPHRPADNPAARLIAILDAGATGPAAMRALTQAQGQTGVETGGGAGAAPPATSSAAPPAAAP